MRAGVHMIIGAVMALTLPVSAAQADQMSLFEQACGSHQDSFAAHENLVLTQGWQRNDTHPALARLIAGQKRNSAITQISGYVNDAQPQLYGLTLTRGSGLTICTVIAPNAETAIDEATFNARFFLARVSAERLLNSITAVFYANETAPPVPRYKIIGDRRPKVERGVVGQLMISSYFTQSRSD